MVPTQRGQSLLYRKYMMYVIFCYFSMFIKWVTTLSLKTLLTFDCQFCVIYWVFGNFSSDCLLFTFDSILPHLYSWIWHPCTYPILVSRMINLLTNVTELSKNLLLKYCAFRLIIFTYILFFRELCCLCQQSLFWFKVTRFVIMITCVI